MHLCFNTLNINIILYRRTQNSSLCLYFTLFFYLFLFPSVCLSVRLFACLCLCVSICQLSACLIVYLIICQPDGVYICLSVYLSVYLSNSFLIILRFRLSFSFLQTMSQSSYLFLIYPFLSYPTHSSPFLSSPLFFFSFPSNYSLSY